MQLPESFKGTDSSGETLLQPTGNSRLQKYVILIQSYVYNEMITLFPIKVPVKKYSNLDWIRQAKNTDLTSRSVSFSWMSWRSFLIFCFSPLCKKKHIELVNAQRCLPRQHSSSSQ